MDESTLTQIVDAAVIYCNARPTVTPDNYIECVQAFVAGYTYAKAGG